MTARASSVSSPALERTRTSNGASSRPAVFILSWPARATARTRVPSRRWGAICGSAPRGRRYSATSSPPVGSTSGSGSFQPAALSMEPATGSTLYRHGEKTCTWLHALTCAPTECTGLEEHEGLAP